MNCPRCTPQPLTALLDALAGHRAAREDAIRRRADALAAYEAAVRDLERAERRVDGVTRDVEARLEAYRRATGRAAWMGRKSAHGVPSVAEHVLTGAGALCDREQRAELWSAVIVPAPPCQWCVEAVDAAIGGGE